MNKKTIWITGGSTGIGKALAIKFANEGVIYKISFFLIIIKLKIVKLTTISIVSSFYKKIEKSFIKLFIIMRRLFFKIILVKKLTKAYKIISLIYFYKVL